MNSRQRRKADRAYKVLQDFVVVRLRISGEVTEEEINIFKEQQNFLRRRLAPVGSYWNYLTPAARAIGVSHYVKAQRNGTA